VQLVRLMKEGRVFQDFLSIRPGTRWEDELRQALEHCRCILVFWCEHSAASAWVRQEYEAGIAAEKEMIPILLDDAEMPPPLRAYQRLDFRRHEPHGGLIRFVAGVFTRSSRRHYYPKDERGEFRDWDHEQFYETESRRRKHLEETQANRHEEIAREIAARLG
jgi:hypothetical protein